MSIDEHGTGDAFLEPGLYVVATPIGNLEDLSSRAARVLRHAGIIAAEDTRTTRRLLPAGCSVRLVSLTEHNVTQRIPMLLAAAGHEAVALASDAGTPAIADPGARLVAAAHEADIRVHAIPGPSALAAALSVSGFELPDVYFLGFLPRKPGARIERLRTASRAATVLACFESPRRLAATLRDVATTLADPEVVVCRELTKIHEDVRRGRASELASAYQDTRGECTIVVQVPELARSRDNEDVREYLSEMRRAGARRSKAAAEAARRFGIDRTAAYALWE